MSHAPKVIDLRAHGQTARVLPHCGGGLARWRFGGHDLLRPARVHDDPLALACFPLVPYCNRIRNGRFSFGGEEIRLPLNFGDHPHSIHGHGWQASWDVTDRQADRVELLYRHAADAWPFAYDARQRIALDRDGLTLGLSLTNLDRRPMPAGLGFHPYFAGASSAHLTADVDGVWLTDDEVMPTEWSPLPAHWNLPAGVAVDGLKVDSLFTGWQGEATIVRPDLGLSLKLTAGAPLRHLVVYAPPGEDFFCVEPVSHTTDAANNSGELGMDVLSPGAKLEVASRIDILSSDHTHPPSAM